MLTTPELINEAGQATRLQSRIPDWLHRVPLYQRSGYLGLIERGLSNLPGSLSHLPFITRDDLRGRFPHNFLQPATDLDKLAEQNLIEVEHTSGTTEERTPLLLPYGWWTDQEQLALRQNKFVADVLDEFPKARRVTINSPMCGNDICYTSVPTRLDRTIGNNLSLSLSRQPFLWSESELERMAEEAVEWSPQFLDVDPVYGSVFAQFCQRQGIRLPSLRFIICSYEFASVVHRRILQRVFNVPVFNLYGATETGHLLMENESGEMAPSLETAFLETVEPDAQGIGELIVTTLTNDYMPLIRYRIGDLVERHEQPYRTTFVLHGRSSDAFTTSSGTRVTTLQIDQYFETITGIAHYQLIEQSDQPWTLRYVADKNGPSALELEKLQEKLMRLLGLDCELELQRVDFLLAEGSGKFRLGYPRSADSGVNFYASAESLPCVLAIFQRIAN